MILHVENAKEFTHTHTHKLELINEFSKVTGYRIIIPKNQFYFYILAMDNPKQI